MQNHVLMQSIPQDHVLILTLNRPESANALNTELGQALRNALREASKNSSLRVVVLTGEGNRAFCAGVDLKERRGMTEAAWQNQHHIFEEIIRDLTAFPVPVIAAVNGAAYGGGCELALACDFIYAAQEARFALPEVTLGIMPGMGGTQNLARSIGSRRARELLLSGRPFSAEQAFEWGMVNQLSYNGQLMNDVFDTAATIARNAPLSVSAIRHALVKGENIAIHKALEVELDYYSRLIPTQDRIEGIAAFNEKRPPQFKGE